MIRTLTLAALSLAAAACATGCGGVAEDGPAGATSASGASDAAAIVAAQPAATPPAVPAAASAAFTSLSDAAKDLTELAQQVALMRREIADIRKQIGGGSIAARPDVPAPRPNADPLDRAEEVKANQSRLSGAEASFRQEPDDLAWSAPMAAAISGALVQTHEALRNEIRSVECRSRTCRVVIGADGSDSLQQALPFVAGRLADTLPSVIAVRPDPGIGREETVLYFSR